MHQKEQKGGYILLTLGRRVVKLLYLRKRLVNMLMRVDERHSRMLTRILRRMQIYGRCGACTNMIRIKRWHHCFRMTITDSCSGWWCHPGHRYMLWERSRLVFSRYLRPMSRSKLWKFSVVVNCRGVHRLHYVWSTIEPKPRIKSLHVPEGKQSLYKLLPVKKNGFAIPSSLYSLWNKKEIQLQ